MASHDCCRHYECDNSRAIAMARASIDAAETRSCAFSEDPNPGDGFQQLIAALDLIGRLGFNREGDANLLANDSIQLGRFHILSERGRGGFGIVLRAFDPDLKRIIALKIPRPERILAGESVESLVLEAQLAARLEHPGIVRVYETGKLGPVWYIASAYCEGPTLGEWVRSRSQSIPANYAVDLVRQVAKAVHYAHSRGVLHLDLKPENILLHEAPEAPAGMQALVTDFGLASPTHSSIESAKARVAGTPAYMAPEQWLGDSPGVGVATDVFALGAILHDLLSAPREPAEMTRSSGFHTSSLNSVPARSNLRNVPKDLDAICQRCLKVNPEDRYGSVHGLAADLERYLAGDSVSVRVPPLPERLLRLGRRYPLYAASLFLFAVVATLSMVSILGLWRIAESNLNALRAEQRLHALTSDQMTSSLLSLTWLVQERQIEPRIRTTETESEFHLLQDFYREVKNWGIEPTDTLKQRALLAASHSLAIVSNITPLDAKQLEKEFVAGVDAWKAVIENAPDEIAWRRALALHVLSYSLRTPKAASIWWRDTGSNMPTLDPKVISIIEIPYARLLVDLAQRDRAIKYYENAFVKLESAIQLLQSRASSANADDDTRVLLTAYNEQIWAAQHLGRNADVARALTNSEPLLASAPIPMVCSQKWAIALSEAFSQRGLDAVKSGDLQLATERFRQAIPYSEQAYSFTPQNTSLAWELARRYQRTGQVYVTCEDYRGASVLYSKAIAVLSDVLSSTPNLRSIVLSRANLNFALSSCLRQNGERSRAINALEACKSDLAVASLGKQDSRTQWMFAVRCTCELAKLYKEEGRLKDAEDSYERTLDTLSQIVSRFGHNPQFKEYVSRSKSAIASLQHLRTIDQNMAE